MKLTRTLKFNPALFGVIPLINVIFLVVVFFALSSRFVLQPGMAVTLPASSFTLGPRVDAQIVSITAGPYPLVYYRDQQIKLEDLADRLAEDHSPDRSIIIQADRLTPQGSVVEVINLCLENGYSVVLATSPKGQ